MVVFDFAACTILVKSAAYTLAAGIPLTSQFILNAACVVCDSPPTDSAMHTPWCDTLSQQLHAYRLQQLICCKAGLQAAVHD